MSHPRSTSMSVDPPKFKLDLDQFIATALSSTPASLHAYFEKFKSLYERKLWHQLTKTLFAFMDVPEAKPFRIDTFSGFVRDFESKINQLRLVELAVKIHKDIDNPQAQLEFLTSLSPRLSTAAQDGPAGVLLLATIAHAKLMYGDVEGAKTDMDESLKKMDQVSDRPDMENVVRAACYAVGADFFKARGEYSPYYKNSLLFLACIDVERDITPEDRLMRAHDLALSAFLSEDIYNFGELLMHPILSALDNTPHDWLKKLLFTFNEGSIGKFEALAPLFPKEPILQHSYPFLRQKSVSCLSLRAFLLVAPRIDRNNLSFDTIARETHLPLDEVEHLIMKGLSLQLIKGTLDQPAQTARITWVQPRVLNREQIGSLAKRLEDWVARLDDVEQRLVEGNGEGKPVTIAA
ncbi:hypothetical protein DL96DRAFT_1714263 [Flagelloscypha sp. PMI_526]|nr:hypothetical protein DL96DRAFT_1714263 [Flagelloscypha sp. PMI_526]